jgi:hypothetical protein
VVVNGRKQVNLKVQKRRVFTVLGIKKTSKVPFLTKFSTFEVYIKAAARSRVHLGGQEGFEPPTQWLTATGSRNTPTYMGKTPVFVS